ncbi:MAG: tRNA uridine-5-carboxymethylaminomethyl(34) synthesis GTPase MnmE, partial [Planctomycetota bacterium]|nr:tRNA uridine-5-carboxymethylaminomethyl(34) synthesis GTPase MnmE [Planctomycetota bacterium]
MLAPRLYNLDDTIAAIASPPGASKIGIIRLSGPRALAIAAALQGSEDAAAAERRLFLSRVRIALRATAGEMPCLCP